jgi:hypothetical protein
LAGFNPVQNDVFYVGEKCEKSGVYEYADTWWGKLLTLLAANSL